MNDARNEGYIRSAHFQSVLFFQMFIDRAAIGRATELISEYKIKPVLLKRASGHTLEDQEFLIHTSRRKRQRNIQDDEQADQLPNRLFLCFQRPHEITCSLFLRCLP